MSPLDTDYRTQMRTARERAVQLRDDWGLANDRGAWRAGKPNERCGSDVVELVGLAVASLSELGNSLVPATEDRCSQRTA